MDTARFQVITPIHSQYRDLVRGLTKEVWPEFMLHDQVANELWHELLDRFAEYQLALYDTQNKRVAGMANSFPLRWIGPLEELPEIVAEAKRRGQIILVLIPVEHLENYKRSPEVEILADNGNLALIATKSESR